MSIATAEKPEQMVSAPESVVTFCARRSDLTLVKKSGVNENDSKRLLQPQSMPERVSFKNGFLKVPLSGFVTGANGVKIGAKDLLVFLEGIEGDEAHPPHPMLGDRLEGFWRLEEPAPTPSTEEHARLSELAQELNVEGLKLFISQEADGWGRAALLEPARQSLERAQRLREEQQEAVAKARAEGEAAAKPKPPKQG